MMIYVAAAYGRQLEMRGVRTQLRQLGHPVTSRWLDQESESTEFGWSQATIHSAPVVIQTMARRDLEDIEAAHAVFSFTDGDLARGGRHVEFGYAMALGRRLFLIGPREHIFHCLGRVVQFPDWEALAEHLATWPVDIRDLIEEEVH